MKNFLYLFFAALWLVPQSLLGQNAADNPTEVSELFSRKGQLYFSIGTAYRTGLIYNFDTSSKWKARGVNDEDLNRGTSFNYSLDYFTSDKLSIGFSHGLRYDHIHEASSNAIPGGENSNAVLSDTYGLLMDYHFNAKYHFSLNTHEFFFQTGISFLNNAPKIAKNPIALSENGVERNDGNSVDLNDVVGSIGVGYQKNRFSLMGGLYFSDENPFYEGGSYILPYFALKYELGNLFAGARK